MQNEITLTQNEIEMIQLKREQEALKEREALLVKAAKNEREIQGVKAQMKKNLDYSRAQVAATKAFLDEMMGGWKLQIDTQNVKYQVRDYLGGGEWESIWEEYQAQETARIVNGQYTIKVDEHVTSGNSWGHGQKNLGFKMYLSGPGIEWAYERKALGRVSTLIKKYDAALAQIRYEADMKAKKASAVETTVAKMKELYPDAEVVAGTSGKYTDYGRRNWESFNTATITFANGIQIVYRVYPDASLGRIEMTFPKMETAYDLMDVMNSVTINK
jgi:hypothetical protein